MILAVSGLTQHPDDCGERCFTLSYVSVEKNTKWRKRDFTFVHNREVCHQWMVAINAEISKLPRPKKLLVLINPISGKGHSKKIYKKTLAPLFQLVGIETDVRVSSRPKEIIEITETYDLQGLSGIVGVGGDGTYHEILSTILARTQQEAGINRNDKNASLESPTVTFGIIPTGDTLQANAFGVYSNGKLLKYAGTGLCYGLTTDIVYLAELYRWMSVFRIPVAILRSFLRRRVFMAKIEYLSVHEGTLNIMDNGEGNSQGEEMAPEWKITERHLETLAFYPFTVTTKPEQAMESNAELLLSQPLSLLTNLRQLKGLVEMKSGWFENEFCDIQKVTEFKFRLPPKTSGQYSQRELRIMCDGEIILLNAQHPEFEVKLFKHVLNVYGA